MLNLHKCDNCWRILPEDELACLLEDIPHIFERIEPGGTVPSGECPCGALAYPLKANEADLHPVVHLGSDAYDGWSPLKGCTVSIFTSEALERVKRGEEALAVANYALDDSRDVHLFDQFLASLLKARKRSEGAR